jgi:hypothetical protein
VGSRIRGDRGDGEINGCQFHVARPYESDVTDAPTPPHPLVEKKKGGRDGKLISSPRKENKLQNSPVEDIARIMDVANRRGDGKSMGYTAPSPSLASADASFPLDAADVTTSDRSSTLEDFEIPPPCDGRGGRPATAEDISSSSPSSDDDARRTNRNDDGRATDPVDDVSRRNDDDDDAVVKASDEYATRRNIVATYGTIVFENFAMVVS